MKLIFSHIVIILLSVTYIFSQTENEEKFKSFFSEANKYLLTENTDTAKYLFLQALKFKPNSDAADYCLAKIYYAENDKYLALNYAEKAYDLNSDNEWYNILLFSIYRDVNDIDKASNIIDNLIKNHKLESNFLMAIQFYFDISNYDKVIELSNLYIENYGIASQIFEFELNSMLLQNDLLGIRAFCNTNMDIILSDYDIRIIALDYLFKIRDYNFVKKIILSNTNSSGTAMLSLSDVYVEENKLDSAYSFLLNSFNYSDVIADNYYNYFDKNKQFFNDNYSFEQIDTVLNFLQLSFPIQLNLLSFLAEENKFINNFYTSIQLYDRLLRINSDDYQSLLNLMNLYAKFSMWTELDSLSEVAIEYFPAQPYNNLFKGISLLNLNELDDAFAYLNQGLVLAFDNQTLLAYFNFYLSQYYRLNNDEDNEKIYYDKAINFANNDKVLLAHFSLYFAENQINKNECLDLLNKVLNQNISDNSASFLYIKAFALYKFEDYDNALMFANQAIINSEFSNFIFYELRGNIYQKLNENIKATDDFNKSVQLGNIKLNKHL